MKRNIAKQWAAALRSGDYKQGRFQLRRGDQFCCLGVLCNLHAQAHPKIAAQQRRPHVYMGQKAYLPAEVIKWAGIQTGDDPMLPKLPTKATKVQGAVRYFTSLNDAHRLSFDKIADLVDANWEKI
jgi:hypothetical protein